MFGVARNTWPMLHILLETNPTGRKEATGKTSYDMGRFGKKICKILRWRFELEGTSIRQRWLLAAV